MIFHIKDIIEVLQAVNIELGSDAYPQDQLNIIIEALNSYGNSIDVIALEDFAMYLLLRYPIFYNIIVDIIKVNCEKAFVTLNEQEVKLYATLAKNRLANEKLLQ